MGWDIEKFVDGPDLDEFGCAICLDALRDPQTLGCPSEHLFCKECLDGYSRPNVCPLSNLGVPWIDFLHAMNAISFTGHKTVGSSWKFIPTGSIVNNAPISVHEPHPDATQRPNQVSWTGKRLKKAYGLDMNMFSVV
ncbi:hypothetical protein RQP46_003240 [Phenoliferia psychrophenolica]